MINGGLFAEKIEFKAWNHHEGGRNPSLINNASFSIFLTTKHYELFSGKQQHRMKL